MISYDIDDLLDNVAAKQANYLALGSLRDSLVGKPKEELLEPEAVFLGIKDFGNLMGNGFACRIDGNLGDGLIDFYEVKKLFDKINAPQTRALLEEVDSLLLRLGISEEKCHPGELGSLWDFDDSSHSIPESVLSEWKGREISTARLHGFSESIISEFKKSEASKTPCLHNVFGYFSNLEKFDSRWWDLETPEAFPALISYLSDHRQELRLRKIVDQGN